MRKALLARKIAKQKKKKDAQRAQEVAVKKAETKLALQTKRTSRQLTGKVFEEEEAAGEDLLRILLKKWADKVKESKDAEFENVWDKKSFRAANAGGPEIVVEATDEKSATGPDSG